MQLELFVLRNRYYITFAIFALAAVLALFSLTGMQATKHARAQTASGTIDVTAEVEGFLTLTISPTSTTLTPVLVTSAGATNIGSSGDILLDVSTNVNNGYTMTIHGSNSPAGLYSSGADHTIPSVSSTTTQTTLVAGTEGYGANVTNSDAATTSAVYDVSNEGDPDGSPLVGPILASTTPQTLVTNGTNQLNATTTLRIKAAAHAVDTPPASDYNDTVVITATVGG